MADLLDPAALHAARWWAETHDHQQPDDRMLAAYGAVIAERVRQAMTPTPALSPQQSQILHLVADGMENQHIADRLYLTSGSVATQLSRVFRKLGVASRTEAVEAARQRGLIGGDPDGR